MSTKHLLSTEKGADDLPRLATWSLNKESARVCVEISTVYICESVREVAPTGSYRSSNTKTGASASETRLHIIARQSGGRRYLFRDCTDN